MQTAPKIQIGNTRNVSIPDPSLLTQIKVALNIASENQITEANMLL